MQPPLSTLANTALWGQMHLQVATLRDFLGVCQAGEVGQHGFGQEGKLLQRNPEWFTMSLGVTLEGQNMRLSSYNGQDPPHLGMHHVLVHQRLGCSVG